MAMSFRAIKMLGMASFRTANFANRITTRCLTSTNLLMTDKQIDRPIYKQSFVNDELKSKIGQEFKNSQQRVFTVPNILTFSRMATAPAIGYFIYNGMHSQALACFAFAATTDLLDGFIARRFKQSSDIGAMIDPIADKMLLMTSLIAMYNVNLLPLWFVKGIVTRDLGILIIGAVLRYLGFNEPPTIKKFFDFKNHPTLGFDPVFESKVCTALQCTLIVLRLSYPDTTQYGWHFFGLEVVTAGFAGLSAAQYFRRALTGPYLGTENPKSRGP